MAKQKLKEVREDQNSEGGIKRKNADEGLEESSTRPKLPRGSQSFELLKTQSGEAASGSGDRDGANTGMTAVKAKAQPPKAKETTPASEVPALKEELAATPKTAQTAKAVQECLNRASTQELCESAKAGTAAPAVQPPPSTPTPCASPTSAAPTLATPPSATPTPSSAKAPAASPPEVRESKSVKKLMEQEKPRQEPSLQMNHPTVKIHRNFCRRKNWRKPNEPHMRGICGSVVHSQAPW